MKTKRKTIGGREYVILGSTTDSQRVASSSPRPYSAADWRVEYRERHPLPRFTHHLGWWYADMVPIMQTTSMGKSFPIHPETPLDDVPQYVVGAYCGINRLCYGTFMMAHSPKHGGGDSSAEPINKGE